VAALLSGGLLALCFAPASIGGLVWIALTPLLAAVWLSRRAITLEPLRLFLLGYLSGLVWFGVSLHWITTVTVPGWMALSAYLAVYPALWACFAGLVARPEPKQGDDRPVWLRPWSNLRSALLAACAWVVLEAVRGWMFSGFGWNSLGVALVANLPIIQIADLVGVPGISFLLVIVNAVAVLTLKRLSIEIPSGRMRPHYDFSLAVLLVAAAFAYGARKILSAPPASAPLSFAAVQANIPIEEKRDPELDSRILRIHKELSETALAAPTDLLIWPEAATPQPLFTHQPSWELVSSLAARHPGDFLLGSVHYDATGDFNSAVLLTESGARAQFYHKMHLVPFGEYVPLRGSFPLFAWVVGDLVPDDFDFGPAPTVLEMSAKPVRLAALICFEDTLASITRRFAREGAQVLITLTNDAWFGKSAASEQHRANAVFRTIETRLPLVRVANTGVTCAFDVWGRETHRLREAGGNTFFAGVLIGEVAFPIEPRQTFYTRTGDLLPWACSLPVVAAGFMRFRRRR
jgi:apolipoprotein N-acyltransferase